VNHLDARYAKSALKKPKPGKNRYHRGAGNNVPRPMLMPSTSVAMTRSRIRRKRALRNPEPDPAQFDVMRKGSGTKMLREKEQASKNAQTNGDWRNSKKAQFTVKSPHGCKHQV